MRNSSRTALTMVVVLLFLLVGSALFPGFGAPTNPRSSRVAPPVAPQVTAVPGPSAIAPSIHPSVGLAGPFNGTFYSTRVDNPTGVSGYAYSIQVDPTTHVAFEVSAYSSSIVAFDDANGTPLRYLVLGSVFQGRYATSVALDTRDHLLFVSVYANPHGWVDVLNETTFRQVSNVSLAASPTGRFVPVWAAWDASSDQVFIQNATGDVLAAINASTLASPVYLTCPVAACGEGGVTAVPELHMLLWMTLRNFSLVYDTENDLLEGILWAPVTSATSGAAYDSLDGFLYVGNRSITAGGTLLRFDPVALDYLGSFTGMRALYGLGYDPTSNILVGVGPGGDQEIATWNAASVTPIAQYNDSSQGPSQFLAVAVDPGSEIAVTAGLVVNATVGFSLPTLSVLYHGRPNPLAQLASAVDTALGEYYVAGYLPDTLEARSEATGTAVWRDAFATTSTLTASLAVDSASGRVYLGRPPSHSVEVFSAATGAATGSIALPGSVYATAIAVDPSAHLLYIARNDSSISVASTLTNLIVGTVPTPGWDACGLYADPSTTQAFAVNCRTPGNVTTVNGLTASLGTVYAVGANPSGLVMDSAGFLYVANSGGTNVTVIRPSTGLVVASIPLAGASPWYLEVDDAAGLLFAVSPYNYTTPVVSLATRAVLGSIPLGDFVGLPAFDPTSRTLIVPSYYAGTTLVATEVARPAAPTGLVATGGNTTAAVAWTAPSVPAGIPLSYNVSIATTASGPWTVSKATNATNATFTGLTDGTTYYVTVNATTPAGTGPDAAPVTVVPAGVPYPPTAVTATAKGSGSVNVTWGLPASSGGASILNYTVFYQTLGATNWSLVSAGTATSSVVGGLSAQTSYRFYVIAWNRLGSSHPSASVTATTASPSSTSGTLGGLSYWAWAVIGVVVVAAVALAAVLMARRRKGPGASLPPAAWSPPPGAVGEATPPPTAPPPAPPPG